MVDTSKFEYEDSRWQDLYLFLQEKGYDVYPPGVKLGECTSPYLVVKNNGLSEHNGFSTNDEYYSIMVYVPKQQYSKLEVLTHKVEADMKEIEPLFMPRHVHTPSYYDDSYQAHMVSLEYKNYKKKLKQTD